MTSRWKADDKSEAEGEGESEKDAAEKSEVGCKSKGGYISEHVEVACKSKGEEPVGNTESKASSELIWWTFDSKFELESYSYFILMMI